MENTRKFYVTFNRERELYLITAHRTVAEEWSDGPAVKIFSAGDPGYSDCQAAWADYLAGRGSASAVTRPDGRLAAAGFPPEFMSLEIYEAYVHYFGVYGHGS